MRVKTTWVAGGSGLVGGELLRLLLADDDFATVVAVGRRPLPLQQLKLRQATADFNALGALDALDAPDAAFCCWGRR